jgi:hypothetical protein
MPTPVPPSSPSTHDKKIVSYIVSLTEEINTLNKEIEDLEPFIHEPDKYYRKYKLKIGARDAMRQQRKDCEEALQRGTL